MTLTYDLDYQFPASYGHDPKTRKISRQKVRTVDSKCKVETNGGTCVLPVLWMKSCLHNNGYYNIFPVKLGHHKEENFKLSR